MQLDKARGIIREAREIGQDATAAEVDVEIRKALQGTSLNNWTIGSHNAGNIRVNARDGEGQAMTDDEINAALVGAKSIGLKERVKSTGPPWMVATNKSRST